jgi:hypothetical protein
VVLLGLNLFLCFRNQLLHDVQRDVGVVRLDGELATRIPKDDTGRARLLSSVFAIQLESDKALLVVLNEASGKQQVTVLTVHKELLALLGKIAFVASDEGRHVGGDNVEFAANVFGLAGLQAAEAEVAVHAGDHALK